MEAQSGRRQEAVFSSARSLLCTCTYILCVSVCMHMSDPPDSREQAAQSAPGRGSRLWGMCAAGVLVNKSSPRQRDAGGSGSGRALEHRHKYFVLGRQASCSCFYWFLLVFIVFYCFLLCCELATADVRCM
jgi:hypothetical protein